MLTTIYDIYAALIIEAGRNHHRIITATCGEPVKGVATAIVVFEDHRGIIRHVNFRSDGDNGAIATDADGREWHFPYGTDIYATEMYIWCNRRVRHNNDE